MKIPESLKKVLKVLLSKEAILLLIELILILSKKDKDNFKDPFV